MSLRTSKPHLPVSEHGAAVSSPAVWGGAVVVALLLILLLMRSCGRSVAASAPAVTTQSPIDKTASRSTPSPVLPGVPAASAPSRPAVIAAGQSGMVSVTFGFDPGDTLSVRTRDEIPTAFVRPHRNIESQPGIFHRIVSATGEVLFEDIVPDPRIIHWDTTDDGRTLRGGIITDSNVPLVLRLPAGVRGRLEIFLLKEANWRRSTLGSAVLLGTFDLQ